MLKNRIKRGKFYAAFRDIITPFYSGFLIRLFGLFPINKKKIFIVSYFGKGYGDNGKYIAQSLLAKDKSLKLYWGAKKEYKGSIPKEIHYVKYFTPMYFFHQATSKIWINNARFLSGTSKRKKQFYIQVWHGGIAFKKIEADASDTLAHGYVKSAKKDGSMTDLMTSGSRFFSGLCYNSFWFNGEVLECGCPRNDVFFNQAYCQECYRKIRKEYRLDKNDKILLYAPTFRNDNALECYNIDFKKTIKTLSRKFKGKWKILIRLHPNIAKKAEEMNNWGQDIINVTKYQDAQDLLMASDIVVTDYSSIAFDFALLMRPIFLYASDYDSYVGERGFYLDYFNLPFTVAKKSDELQKNILNFSEKEYERNLSKFFKDEIGLKESGKAAEAVAKRILKEIKK